jgi:hypothetical protein
VPASIDATGTKDVSAALASFINGVPDGSTIRFQAGGTYRLGSGGIILSNRHDLVLDGRGATLQAFGCGADESPIKLRARTSDITIRDFTLVGDNTAGGTSSSHHLDCQSQAGITLFESYDILIEAVTIRHTNGDCVYVDLGTSTGPRIWSDGLVWRDSTCHSNGRMGLAVVGGRDILVERVHFDKIAMYPFDIEPNFSDGGGAFITFRDNTVGTHTVDTDWHPYFFAANGEAGDDNVHDITVTRNTVTGGTLRSSVDVPTRRNIVFTDNTSTVTAAGPVLFFGHIDGLTVTGNRQPLSSGALASISDSTNVTYRP